MSFRNLLRFALGLYGFVVLVLVFFVDPIMTMLGWGAGPFMALMFPTPFVGVAALIFWNAWSRETRLLMTVPLVLGIVIGAFGSLASRGNTVGTDLSVDFLLWLDLLYGSIACIIVATHGHPHTAGRVARV